MDGFNNASDIAGLVFVIFSLAVSIFFLVCSWKIYNKMGEPGWKCIIPIYCVWVLCKHVVGAGWKMFLTIIPIFGTFYALYIQYKLFEKFGFSTITSILFMIFPVVGLPVAAFSDAAWSD